MKKPTNILETGEYVEPYTFSTEAEAVLFHAYIEQLEFIEEVSRERDLLIEALKNILSEFEDKRVQMKTPIAYFRHFNKAEELLTTIKK